VRKIRLRISERRRTPHALLALPEAGFNF